MWGWRRRWSGAVVLLALGVGAGTAAGDGLPVLGVDAGPTGVVDPAVGARFVTMPAGANTVVARITSGGGVVSQSRALRGALTIPAVAYDGSAGGLSADGTSLALIEPRSAFPRARTRFEILNTRNLRTRSVIELRGDFSFDAISPDGRLLYLVNYTSANDPTRYRVRAFDVRANRLLPAPIVDPTEPDEQMRGTPMTRTMSPDGRWAYTLYQGFDGTPFIHALDTVGVTARCIDLDLLAGQDVSAHRLDASGPGSIVVENGGRVMATIDLSTFRAGAPVTAKRPAQASSRRPWLMAAGGALGIAVVCGVGLLALRRRRPAPTTGVRSA